MIGARFLIAIAGILLTVQANAEDVATAQDVATAEDVAEEVEAKGDTQYPEREMEEIVVEADRTNFDIDPVMMDRIRQDNGHGGVLYRQRRYKEAYPYLLAAAQRGFKLSQARLSYIYQQGLGGVPRNSEAAVGWLGVAASRTTSPGIRKYYKNFIKHIPEERMPEVNDIVEDYTARYGSKAVGLNCSMTRLAKRHISGLICEFDNEFRFRDSFDEDGIQDAIGATGGSNGET